MLEFKIQSGSQPARAKRSHSHSVYEGASDQFKADMKELGSRELSLEAFAEIAAAVFDEKMRRLEKSQIPD